MAHFSGYLDPLGRLMGMDGVILMAFILGLPANEIVIPIIIMAYTSQGTLIEPGNLSDLHTLLISQGWTWITALCTMIFFLFHWPCSTTLMTIKKETGSLKSDLSGRSSSHSLRRYTVHGNYCLLPALDFPLRCLYNNSQYSHMNNMIPSCQATLYQNYVYPEFRMTNHYDHKRNRTSRSSYRGPRKGRRPVSETEKGKSLLSLAAAGAGILLLAAVSSVTIFHFKGKPAAGSHETSLFETDASLTAPAVTVNGISLNGLSPDESFEALNQLFLWDMKAEYGEEQLAVENPLSPRLKEWIETLCRSSQSGELTLTPADLIDEELKKEILIQAETFAKKWETTPKNSGLDYFDPQKGSFIFTEGCSGIEIDERRLAEDILSAIRENRLDAVIPVHSTDAAPPLSKAMAKEQYKTIAAFTTETTSNQKRNTNVRLAAEALNGTIVQPGEEFSFNQAVGQRTAEKGYQEAAAYSSGAVVQEIGGGVCQISSTLYRVAFNAGMEITFRRSHTFEPNYVTPGQDAAISWEQPDFRFVNTSSAPIGIRASDADRKATVSIYGIPVLEEGVSWRLYSEKGERTASSRTGICGGSFAGTRNRKGGKGSGSRQPLGHL